MRTAIAIVCLLAAFGCKSKDEQLQSAEDKAKFLAEMKARAVKGVGEALKNDGKAAAESVSAGASEVIKGVGKGFGEGLNAVKVTVTAPEDAGLKVTRANRMSESDVEPDKRDAARTGVTVYVVFEKPFAGKLDLKALDSSKNEIGRATAELNEKAPTAKYVDFFFDPRTPMASAETFELR